VNEAATWLGRLLALLPEIIGLWKAVDSKDEAQTLDAVLTLRRKISDEQMREALK